MLCWVCILPVLNSMNSTEFGPRFSVRGGGSILLVRKIINFSVFGSELPVCGVGLYISFIPSCFPFFSPFFHVR